MAEFLLEDIKAVQHSLEAFGNNFVALIPGGESEWGATGTPASFGQKVEPISVDEARNINSASINGLCDMIEKTDGLGRSYVAFFRKRIEKALGEGKPFSGRALSKFIADLIDAKEWEEKKAKVVHSKFNYEVERFSEVAVVVRVSGRLDAATVEVFEKNVLGLAQDPTITRFVLSCAEFEYVASTGLRVFVAIIKALNARNAKFYIAGLRPEMLLILKTTGLQKFMVVKETVEECLSDIDF